jgi:hypothetical protein
MGYNTNIARVSCAIVFAACVVLHAQTPAPAPAGQSAEQPPLKPTFRVGTELVLVNVVVRDRSGNVVRGLTRDDFIITEDNKPQSVSSFDFEELDRPDAGAG